MNLFVVEDEYTYYLRLYIFLLWKMNTRTLFCVEDEYTYYFRLYILGYEPFCRVGR